MTSAVSKYLLEKQIIWPSNNNIILLHRNKSNTNTCFSKITEYMISFGFKNFRRFEDFPMIQLGGITIFVGANNSGKSTAMKALSFFLDNVIINKDERGILNPPIKGFSFGGKGINQRYLGDYMSNSNSSSLDMEISVDIDHIYYRFVLDGNGDNKSSHYVPLKKCYIQNRTYGIEYKYLFTTSDEGIVNYTIERDKFIDFVNKEKRKNEGLSDLMKDLEASKEEVLQKYGIRERAGKIKLQNPDAQDWDAILNDWNLKDEKVPFSGRFFVKGRNVSFNDANSYEPEVQKFLWHASDDMRKNLNFNSLKNEYIETHQASHKLILDGEDKNNYLAQTINNFQSNLTEKEQEEIKTAFLFPWLDELNICSSFNISSIAAGEAFTVNIEKADGTTMPLGKMGTGSIQLFILLMHIAIAISKGEEIIILIEEPEQNLHPKLQSKLAELFLEVYEKTSGRVRFVVETHSEYLVRKTQVLVAKKKYPSEKDINEGNPFSLYYFPCDALPYALIYRPDGCFANDFGEGFYDEAVNLSFEIL